MVGDLKIGGKLLCRKSLHVIIRNNDNDDVTNYHYDEGEYYKIAKIVVHDFSHRHRSVTTVVMILDKNYKEWLAFYSEDLHLEKCLYIWDYFYTSQEVRELKLKKLRNEK